MHLAGISVIIPAIARLPLIEEQPQLVILFIAVLLATGVVHDFRIRRRVHPVTLWGGLFVLASAPVRAFLGRSEIWQSLAQWLLSMPSPLGLTR